MRLLAILFLICGVALAGGAVYYAMEHFPQREAALANQQAGPETVMVVAAKLPLKMGDQLSYERGKDYLKFVEWPKDIVPDSAFFTADELFGENKSETRSVLRAIEPGELILKSKVSGFGQTRFSIQLPDGMYPVPIPVNTVSGVAGLISPGDRVDIQYIVRQGETMASYILLESVLVLAIDQVTDTERNRALSGRTVTVAVSRKDAQTLNLAMQEGTLSLLLRGLNDVETSEAPTTVDSSILPGAAVPEPEPEVKPEPEPEDTGYKVRVRKGANLHEERFE
jgi:pilus assembly protein CpaB